MRTDLDSHPVGVLFGCGRFADAWNAGELGFDIMRGYEQQGFAGLCGCDGFDFTRADPLVGTADGDLVGVEHEHRREEQRPHDTYDGGDGYDENRHTFNGHEDGRVSALFDSLVEIHDFRTRRHT